MYLRYLLISKPDELPFSVHLRYIISSMMGVGEGSIIVHEQNTSKAEFDKPFIVFAGAGLATVVISFLFTTYYNVIITWAFYYLFNCFQSVLPWTACDHDWNSPNCWDGTATQNYTNTTTNSSYLGPATKPNGTISPTEDFYQ